MTKANQLDKDFLSDPSQWSSFADSPTKYCCLKRGNEHGFIITGSKWEVFLGNVWDGGTGQTIPYDSLDDLLAAGWIVD